MGADDQLSTVRLIRSGQGYQPSDNRSAKQISRPRFDRAAMVNVDTAPFLQSRSSIGVEGNGLDLTLPLSISVTFTLRLGFVRAAHGTTMIKIAVDPSWSQRYRVKFRVVSKLPT